MSTISAKLLFWAPRLLSILFIAFLSLFALDVFDEHLAFLPTASALLIHLLPSLLLAIALVLTWRREWIGSLLYAAAGLLYVVWVATVSRSVPVSARLTWVLIIAGPAFLIAYLFLLNWRKHDSIRTALRHS